MEKKSTHVITIDKNTRLGGKEFVQGAIHGIVTAVICISEGTHPKDVFACPDLCDDSKSRIYVSCTDETFELVRKQVREHYPNVCSFHTLINE